MKNLLTLIINVIALGLICLVIFVAFRSNSSAGVIASSAELPAGVQANFNKELSDAIASSRQAQMEMLAEQLKLLQKIDTNVNRLVGAPASVATSAPKAAEDKTSVEVEAAPVFSSGTYRGIFRRGGTIRQSTNMSITSGK